MSKIVFCNLFSEMKHILLTGGAGFIGSNLTSELLTGNYRVTCLDNFDNFYSRKQKEINIRSFYGHENYHLIEGDIRKKEDIEAADNVDVIVHLAAKAGVRPSMLDPAIYEDVNVKGTLQLLEYARERKLKQFVYASSSSVYGVNPNVPWTEEEKLLPISPYASTKLSCEMMGREYSTSYGIRFLALRFFTVYGPSQRPDLAIYKFFDAILKEKPIAVYGNGSSSRDYTYVRDTVKGIKAAITYEQSNFEIINLGNHRSVKLMELIRAIESIIGKKAVIDLQPEQPGDVPHTYADISKAEQLLNYYPETDLMTGLSHFYKWFKANQYELNKK
jgi:UDP-glucuronate 4-epimerase